MVFEEMRYVAIIWGHPFLEVKITSYDLGKRKKKAIEACYVDRNFQKGSLWKKKDLYFSSKHTCILITMHYTLIFTGSLRKEPLRNCILPVMFFLLSAPLSPHHSNSVLLSPILFYFILCLWALITQIVCL
jgi:hypothetical protein